LRGDRISFKIELFYATEVDLNTPTNYGVPAKMRFFKYSTIAMGIYPCTFISSGLKSKLAIIQLIFSIGLVLLSVICLTNDIVAAFNFEKLKKAKIISPIVLLSLIFTSFLLHSSVVILRVCALLWTSWSKKFHLLYREHCQFIKTFEKALPGNELWKSSCFYIAISLVEVSFQIVSTSTQLSAFRQKKHTLQFELSNECVMVLHVLEMLFVFPQAVDTFVLLAFLYLEFVAGVLKQINEDLGGSFDMIHEKSQLSLGSEVSKRYAMTRMQLKLGSKVPRKSDIIDNESRGAKTPKRQIHANYLVLM
jgi:hypothetical protein